MWHLSRFQPSEVIDIAVQVEEKGEGFYKRLAEKASTPKIKELLLYLATEEQGHQTDFKALLKNLEGVDPRESYAGEYLDYLNSIVETHMFADAEWMEKLVENAKSETDIIKLAAVFEKDSILFFQSFRAFLNEEKRAVVDKLVKEEEMHLVKLAKVKQDLEGVR